MIKCEMISLLLQKQNEMNTCFILIVLLWGLTLGDGKGGVNYVASCSSEQKFYVLQRVTLCQFEEAVNDQIDQIQYIFVFPCRLSLSVFFKYIKT